MQDKWEGLDYQLGTHLEGCCSNLGGDETELGKPNLTWKRRDKWESYVKEKQQDLMTNWVGKES